MTVGKLQHEVSRGDADKLHRVLKSAAKYGLSNCRGGVLILNQFVWEGHFYGQLDRNEAVSWDVVLGFKCEIEDRTFTEGRATIIFQLALDVARLGKK